MTTMTLGGSGILSGTWDSEEIDRRRAEERARDKAYAEREAKYTAELQKIDAISRPI